MTLARVLGAIGRTLITGGTLILLFVVYQLWGTGLREQQAQNRLETQFEEQLAEAAAANEATSTTTSTTSSTTLTTVDPSIPTTTATLPPVIAPPMETIPPDGDPAARILIPKIGVDKIVVQGVALTHLKKGPGHYPTTPFPGQAGNAAIAGHRTTYGAPFGNIDQLVTGDEIRIETVQGSFRYVVMTEPQIVSPNATEVLHDFGDNRLTLTACHPKYSARQRIVVTAALQGEPAPPPEPDPIRIENTPDMAEGPSLSLSGERADKLPAVLFGVACAVLWIAAWLIGRRWRKWPAYLIGFPFFMVLLYFFFENFARLLPSNY